MPIETVEWSIDEPDLAVAALNEAYGLERPLSISGDPSGFACWIWHATAGELGAGRVRHTMAARVTMPPAGYFLASTLLHGALNEISVAGQTTRARLGDPVLSGQETELVASWTDIEVATLDIPWAVVDRVAVERTEAGQPVRFDAILPVSPSAARRWRQLTTFVQRAILWPDSMLEEPLVQAHMADLIAATALVTFRNSAMSTGAARSRVIAAPVSIRRAAEFVTGNAQRPITVTEIAEFAGVTPRALQYGFRRHLETTPMDYLRRVRLEHAYRDLQRADPTAGTTVAEIARRWGFAKPGRFAHQYHSAYGQSPSDTLRT